MASKVSKRLKQLDSASTRPGSQFGGPPGGDEAAVAVASFVMATLIGVVLLFVPALFFGIQSVQGAYESQAEAALRAFGYDEVEASAIGNNVVLNGPITPEQSVDEAIAAVALVPGIGLIDSQLFVATPTAGGESVVVGEPITLSWTRGTVTVIGEVSSSEIVDFIGENAAAGPISAVDTSALSVLEGVADETDWIGGVLALMQMAAEHVDEGQVVANPSAGLVIVAGVVEDRQARRDLYDDAEERIVALGFDFTSGIALAEAPPVPIKEQVVALQADLDDLIVGKVVEFEVTSAVITPVGTALLDEIVVALTQFPDVPIEIAGHADAQGDAEENLELSTRRAEAVLVYLVANGLDAERFVVVGYGETQPIADNSTAEGRARNRRIEFIALED